MKLESLISTTQSLKIIVLGSIKLSFLCAQMSSTYTRKKKLSADCASETVEHTNKRQARS